MSLSAYDQTGRCLECGEFTPVNGEQYCARCMPKMFDMTAFRKASKAGASLEELQKIVDAENRVNEVEREMERKNIITAFQIGVL